MNVASMMSRPVHTARKETPVAEVVQAMIEHRISAVPIVDDHEQVVGVVTVSELIPHVRNAPASNVPLMSLQNEYVDFASVAEAYEKFATVAASDVMNPSPVTVGPDVEMGTAVQMMVEHEVGALPVVRDDGVLVGIVTRTDVARLTLEPRRE